MKNVFFLALLANLVFFLWQYHIGGFHHPSDETLTVAPPNLQPILLVFEQKKQPPPINIDPLTPTATVVKADANVEKSPLALTKPETSVPVTYCYQIGVFANKKALTQWLRQQGLDSTTLQLKENQPVVADYVVSYPAAATFADSKKNIAFLKARGINDFFMINNGEFKGTISLGVFKNEARATKVQQSFIQKGINAKVTKRYKTLPSVSARIKTTKTKAQLLASLPGYAVKSSVELLSKCK